MIILPTVIVEGSTTFDQSLLPADAIKVVIDIDKVTIYQAGDALPEGDGA